MNFRTFLLSVLLLSMNFLSAQSDIKNSWQQFRGNNRNGHSPETKLIEKWNENGPELIWKKNIGCGFTEVLVKGDKIYTMTSEYNTDSTAGIEFMAAYNINTGDEIWKTKVDSLFIDVDGFGDGPRSTPAVDRDKVYCISSFGKFNAISVTDGKILWSVDFVKEFESTMPRWAFSSSPILLDNELIVEIGGTNNRGFASFDKKTGKTLWIKGTGHSTYCSPAIAKIEGKNHLIFANDTMLTSFDSKGNELWSYRMPLRFPTAMPLFIAPNKIFVSSVSQTGSFMVQIENNTAKEVYNSTSMKNNWSSSCYYNGYIYGFSNATLKCVSATDGTSKWSKRALGKGSLILVGDKLLVLSDKGVLKMVDTNPEVYTELNSFQALEGKSWTAPSFANGKLYVRNLSEMASYKLK